MLHLMIPMSEALEGLILLFSLQNLAYGSSFFLCFVIKDFKLIIS